jgi:hypothetical protein
MPGYLTSGLLCLKWFLIDDRDYIIEDSVCSFGHIISLSDTSFVILGKIGPDYVTNEL